MKSAIETVIEKSIEGGYNTHYKMRIFPDNFWTRFCHDPQFWKCLGQAMGWAEFTYGRCPHEGLCGLRCDGARLPSWKEYWHKFIDYIAEGKEAEKFFEELLNNK